MDSKPLTAEDIEVVVKEIPGFIDSVPRDLAPRLLEMGGLALTIKCPSERTVIISIKSVPEGIVLDASGLPGLALLSSPLGGKGRLTVGSTNEIMLTDDGDCGGGVPLKEVLPMLFENLARRWADEQRLG